ncbi:MAG TPA: hypothetical protein VHC95_07065 [Opitutales bacterium]|nr:hypothetical protein [Opitutales bacterium]
MTTLEKPITRKAARTIVQGRPLVVTLLPGKDDDIIEVRQHGRRTRYAITVRSAYSLGAKNFAATTREERKKSRGRRR